MCYVFIYYQYEGIIYSVMIQKAIAPDGMHETLDMHLYIRFQKMVLIASYRRKEEKEEIYTYSSLLYSKFYEFN